MKEKLTMCNQSVITKKVHELKQLKSERDALDAKISKIENYLKDQMTEQGVYEFIGDDYRVTWNEVESNRFNQKLFESEYPELYLKFKVPSKTRRFLIG